MATLSYQGVWVSSIDVQNWFPMDFEPDSLDIVFRLDVFECVDPTFVPSFLQKTWNTI